ncbi:MAG: elongation factor 1-beta [Nanoarchaeota archaeon]
MADIIITLKIMPESVNIDLKELENKVVESIQEFTGETEIKKEIEPVAFGLKALKITFVMDENRGGTEELENNIAGLDGVNSVEVIDVRRAIG